MIGPKIEASLSGIRPPVLTSPTLVTLAQKMRSELRFSSHELLSPLPLCDNVLILPKIHKLVDIPLPFESAVRNYPPDPKLPRFTVSIKGEKRKKY